MGRPTLFRSDILCAHCGREPEGVAHYGVENLKSPHRNRIHAMVSCHGAVARIRITWAELEKAQAEGRKLVLFEDENPALEGGQKKIEENRTLTIDIASACD